MCNEHMWPLGLQKYCLSECHCLFSLFLAQTTKYPDTYPDWYLSQSLREAMMIRSYVPSRETALRTQRQAVCMHGLQYTANVHNQCVHVCLYYRCVKQLYIRACINQIRVHVQTHFPQMVYRMSVNGCTMVK